MNREVRILRTVGRTVTWPQPTQDKHKLRGRQTSMLRVGFESKIQMFERGRTFRSSERAATHRLLTSQTGRCIVEFVTNIASEN